jgi:glutamate synthase (NADPH/NADH) large chain
MVALEPVPEEEAASETGEIESHGKVDVRHLGRADDELLRSLIEKHAQQTGSERAKLILANWDRYRSKFVKVMPNEYRRALKELAAQQKEAA